MKRSKLEETHVANKLTNSTTIITTPSIKSYNLQLVFPVINNSTQTYIQTSRLHLYSTIKVFNIFTHINNHKISPKTSHVNTNQCSQKKNTTCNTCKTNEKGTPSIQSHQQKKCHIHYQHLIILPSYRHHHHHQVFHF